MIHKLRQQYKGKLSYFLIYDQSRWLNIALCVCRSWFPMRTAPVRTCTTRCHSLGCSAPYQGYFKYKQMHKQLQNIFIINILTDKAEHPQFHTRFYAHSVCVLHFFVIVNALNRSWKHPPHLYTLFRLPLFNYIISSHPLTIDRWTTFHNCIKKKGWKQA